MGPMRMILVKTPRKEDMEPELVIFCKQARLQEDGVGKQPIHKTFDLTVFLPSEWDRNRA